MREALERLRPLASDALLAMFQLTMSEATEKAAERTLQREAEPEPPRRKRSKARRSSGARASSRRRQS